MITIIERVDGLQGDGVGGGFVRLLKMSDGVDRKFGVMIGDKPMSMTEFKELADDWEQDLLLSLNGEPV